MDHDIIINIQNQFQAFSRSVFNLESIHCHFTAFNSKRVTWQKRLNLRKTLVQKLKQHYTSTANRKTGNIPVDLWENLLKPTKSLKNPLAAISISHCPALGGFIFSFDKRLSLGLDVELADRLTDKLLSRISTEEELKSAPGAAFLWVAKEAGFKCACSFKKTTKLLSQCVVSYWKQIGSENYSFHFQIKDSKYIKGRGFVFSSEGAVLAAAILKHNLY